MAVDPDFRFFALAQLSQVSPLPITSKDMFGGVMVYAGTFPFALVADEELYLKADKRNRDLFIEQGMNAFAPWPEKDFQMSYYHIPDAILENVPDLEIWVGEAIAAAQRVPRKKKKLSSDK